MQPPPSAIPAAKAALITAIQNQPGATGVQVVYGFPARILKGDIIAVLGADGDHTASSGGTPSREDDFTLDCLASVFKGGSNQQAATERAFELMALVEAATDADAKLGGAVDSAQVRGSVSLTEGKPKDVKPAGRIAEVAFGVRCVHRVYG